MWREPGLGRLAQLEWDSQGWELRLVRRHLKGVSCWQGHLLEVLELKVLPLVEVVHCYHQGAGVAQ